MSYITLMDDTMPLEEILYDDSNGIGVIHPVKGRVIEELNGLFECEFTVPVTYKHFSEIHCGGIIKVKPNDATTAQMFRIYEITKPMRGVVTVSARHISYDLNKAAVLPFTALGVTSALNGLKAHVVGSYPFDVWTDMTNTTSKMTVAAPVSFRKALGGSEGSVLDTFGGEFQWDNLTVKLLAHRGRDNGVTIEYGKNLTDLRQEENIESTYNAVIGYASSEGEPIVGDIQYAVETTSPKTKIIDFSSAFGADATPTKEQINQLSRAYIQRYQIGIPSVNIEVKFVPLWQTEEYKNISSLEWVQLGDTVSVKFPRLGVTAKAKVVRTVWDVVKNRYDSIEIGSVRSTLASTISDNFQQVEENAKTAQSSLEKAIVYATNLLKGGLGGHLVIGTNAEGQPNELLIMDTEDKETAVNVWRFNLNGLGHSHSGYDGPFDDVALTMDGKINASMITVGIMTATLIRAGLLSDVSGKNFWNLETGDFSLSSEVKIDNDKSFGDVISDTQKSAEDAIEAEAKAREEAITSALNEAKGYADDLDEALTQNEVFNRLTNKGALKGIYMQNGELYINASYLKTGTLAASLIAANSIAVEKLTGTITNGNWKLDLNKGTFTIGEMSANKITSGTFSADRISGGTINANSITVDNIDAGNISRGTLSSGRLDGYNGDDITVVNWDGRLQHLQWDNGLNAWTWGEDSVFWKQIYYNAGGNDQYG